jgi:hypothetical protein
MALHGRGGGGICREEPGGCGTVSTGKMIRVMQQAVQEVAPIERGSIKGRPESREAANKIRKKQDGHGWRGTEAEDRPGSAYDQE